MDLDEALSELLPEGGRTGRLTDDLIAAAIAWRQQRDPHRLDELGAVTLGYLRQSINPATGQPWSLREIERATGIPKDTVARRSEG